MNKNRVFDYIFLLRPSIMVAVWTFFFAGVYIGYKMNDQVIFWSRYNLAHILYTLFLYTLLMGGAYVLNQIVDVDTDRINNKLFILSGGHISIRNAYIYMTILYFASLLPVFIDKTFSINLKLLFIFSFAMGILYSSKPFSFKRRPFLDLIANALGYGYVAVIIGYESTGYRFYYSESLIALPYLFAMAAVFINTTLLDYDGDKEVNALTTGVFLGKKKASILSAVFMSAALLTGVINRDIVAASASFPSLILFIICALSPDKKKILISVKYSSPIMTVILCVIFPYFLFMCIAVLISMKIYYKKRFNYDYP